VSENLDTEQALESARCAYINLNNMVKLMPALRSHPLLPMVKMQLGDAIKALGDTGFVADEESQ
jgi:hypothetical protein